VVREGVGAGGRNEPSLYAHMNNKRERKKNKFILLNLLKPICNLIMLVGKKIIDVLLMYINIGLSIIT
jgi:hypothetical protein